MSNPKDSKAAAAAAKTSAPGAADTTTGSGAGEPAPEPGSYKPVGKVVELAKNTRNGKTVRVLQDDKRVWKEER